MIHSYLRHESASVAAHNIVNALCEGSYEEQTAKKNNCAHVKAQGN